MAKRFIPGQMGMTLTEVIIALALLGIISITLLTALSTGLFLVSRVEDSTTASTLARAQLEFVEAQTYTEPPTYPTITPPSGYYISSTASVITPNQLQEIRTTVSSPDKTLLEVVGYKANPSFVASPSTLTLAQQDYRWFQNINDTEPITSLAGQNTPITGATLTTIYRIRMNLEAGGRLLNGNSQAFKLQFSTSTGGPWTDVGVIGSGVIWRGYNNAAPADGTTISNLLLTTSNVPESYEEANPSIANPNALNVGQRGEWDWVMQHNGAAPNTTYYFRMVKSDGTALDGYTNYPTLTTTATTFTQRDYRWYANANAVQPTTPLAAENTAYTATTPGLVYRIRMNVEVGTSNLPAATLAFKLQFSTSTGGPWTDVAAIGSGTIWRGYDNTTPADGATITSLLLTGTYPSNVLESYEEQNPSVANPNAINAGQRGEWDWVVQDNGAANNITYYFQMVRSDGTALDDYTYYPTLTTPPALSFTQRNYRWYANADAIQPTTALAAENTPITGATPTTVYRIRMNIEVGGANLPASSQAFKLQFSTSTGGPWTDVGAIGSGTIWRGYDNTTPADGATITSLLLSTSNVLESYEEQNPSVANPNAINAGQRGEWDWVVQDYNALGGTIYYFQMVKSDGTDLDAYTNYPQLTTTPLTLTQQDYRWYANADAIQPTAALAAQNTPITGATLTTVYRIRVNLEVGGANLPASTQAFKLQFSTSTGGPWTDVGAIGSGTIWRGYNNAAPADGATITALLLTTSNVLESYEEENPSVANPNAINLGQRGEWDWVVQDYNALGGDIYYFRIAKSDGTALDGYTNYPQVTTTPLTLTQRDYRWYQNADSLDPTVALAAENTPITGATLTTVYRIRMNAEVGGANLPASTQAFKLQFSTSTGGPWTDVGAIGSGTIWRGYDNASPADGATITVLRLSSSNVLESYEEENPSVANPNAINLGQRGEWDWVVQDYNALGGTIYYFRIVKSDGTALDGYTNYPQVTATPLTFTQRDYRWYANADAVQPTTPLATENTSITGATPTTVYRIRMNTEVGGANLPAAMQAFKLQFSTSTGGPWTDVGAIGSGVIWRGYDNTTPADGAAITSLLLSTSNVLESYEEQNPSVANPNAINLGQRGEWDWVVQHNGAAPSTVYYFRIVLGDGTVLGGYTNYPTVTTQTLTLTQRDYRWYANANAVQPTIALAAENTAYTTATHGLVYRIRVNVEVGGANLPAASQAFKLQFSTSTGGPWTDVGAIGSGVIWRGYDNTTPADGATITSLLLSTSNVLESYEEQNPSVANPNAINLGQRGEWDWVVQDNNAANSITYYFQMVKSDGTVLEGYTNYPTLTTPPALTFTQQDYRWYLNANAVQPTYALAAQTTAYTVDVPATVYRLRMNVAVGGAILPAASQAFKLQFSTSTSGPWTDVGAIGSGVSWRGYNNATPADGAAITALLLTTSNVLESYEEENPSVANPNAINVGQRGEWDWVVQDNGAVSNTAYYFRMVKSDGSALDVYTNYPRVNTPLPRIAWDDFESAGWAGGSGWLAAWTYSGDALVTTTGTAHNSSYHMRLRSSTGYAKRSVNLSGKTTVRLQFWAKADNFEAGETAQVLVSSNGTTWTAVKTWVDGEDDNVYRFWDIDLSSYSLTSAFWIAFDANMSNTVDYFYVDDIQIVGQ